MTFIVADRVRDTSTTTGTGALTIEANPPTGYRTFSAVCAVNDTMPYFIAHQTADEWEVGIGTYSAANTLTRTTVLSSSNSNAAVSFSAGTKDVVLSVPATNAFGRERIFADRTYYVRSDGSDSNTGLANNAAGAKLTIGGAMAAINGLDFNGFHVTLQLQNTTYNESIIVSFISSNPNWCAWVGEGELLVDGGGGTIAGNGTGHPSIAIYGGLPAGFNSTLLFQNGTLSSSDASCAEIDGPGFLTFGLSVTLGASGASSPKIVAYNAGIISNIGDLTISGNSSYFGLATNGQIQIVGATMTVSGTPAFTAFYRADYHGTIVTLGMTFSGSATGKRYEAETNGIIQTNGGGANYLPGNAAGTTATQGQYL